MREHVVELVYAPYRVWYRHCGLRVERIPWAEKWQRVTHALFRIVATVVEGAVLWGLQHYLWRLLHRLGIDEVSRRKGQQHLTVVYDLNRGTWYGLAGIGPRAMSCASPARERRGGLSIESTRKKDVPDSRVSD